MDEFFFKIGDERQETGNRRQETGDGKMVKGDPVAGPPSPVSRPSGLQIAIHKFLLRQTIPGFQFG